MVCQLKSVEEVGNLWSTHYESHASEYAAVAFVRPDVQYDVPFPTQVIPRLQVRNPYVISPSPLVHVLAGLML